MKSARLIPQRLKPRFVAQPDGTTEVVPFPFSRTGDMTVGVGKSA